MKVRVGTLVVSKEESLCHSHSWFLGLKTPQSVLLDNEAISMCRAAEKEGRPRQKEEGGRGSCGG